MADKVIVKLHLGRSTSELICSGKKTVLESMMEQGLGVYSPCSLCGKCGRCVIRFHKEAPLPTVSERMRFTAEQLREGYRLACMAVPVCSSEVTCLFPTEREKVVTECPNLEYQKNRDAVNTVLAIDVGTTTISMILLDADTGKVVAEYGCNNPQLKYGTDVITRIQAASHGDLACMREMILQVIASGIDELCRNSMRPLFAVVAANMCMSGILRGLDVSCLGSYPFQSEELCKPGLVVQDRLVLFVIPGISGFIGGDCVAGLMESSLIGKEEVSLFLDLGTNAEMVIGNREMMIGTAAAAGSAFLVTDKTGSSAIATLAQYMEEGLVDETGYLSESGMITLTKHRNDESRLTQVQIRAIQNAKAAVAAGIEILCKHAGLLYEHIDQVILAGGFGYFLNKESAVRIGMIPEALKDKITIAGNTSAGGASKLALHLYQDFRGCTEDDNRDNVQLSENEMIFCLEWLAEQSREIREKMTVLNLAEQKEFGDLYISHINLI